MGGLHFRGGLLCLQGHPSRLQIPQVQHRIVHSSGASCSWRRWAFVGFKWEIVLQWPLYTCFLCVLPGRLGAITLYLHLLSK
jgi:hypothetical protein